MFTKNGQNLRYKRNSFLKIGAKIWNEIPCLPRELQKSSLKKRIQAILLGIHDDEDSFIEIHKIISRVKYSATKV